MGQSGEAQSRRTAELLSAMVAADLVRKLFYMAEVVDVDEADEVYPRGWFWPTTRAGNDVTVTRHVKCMGPGEKVFFFMAIGTHAAAANVTDVFGRPDELVQQHIEWSPAQLVKLLKESENGELTQEGGDATDMAEGILCGTSCKDPEVNAALLAFCVKVLRAIVAYVRNPVGAA